MCMQVPKLLCIYMNPVLFTCPKIQDNTIQINLLKNWFVCRKASVFDLKNKFV